MINIFNGTPQSIFQSVTNECDALEAAALCEEVISDLFELHDLTQDYNPNFRKKHNLLRAFRNMYLSIEIEARKSCFCVKSQDTTKIA